LRVEDEKMLTLNGYRAMLNIRPIGEERVPFFSIVIIP
jgi:hypothetical protein